MTETRPQRGQLRYEVSTSSDHLECGKQFSITVEINNPFDVPVSIKGVTTKCPTEFVNVDEESLQQEKSRLQQKLHSIIATTFPDTQEQQSVKRALMLEITKELFRSVPIIGSALASGATVAQYIRASTPTTATVLQQATGSISAEDIQRAASKATGSPDDAEIVKAEMIRILHEKLQSYQATIYQTVTLQPGDSTVQVFTLRSDQSILFRPASYNLHIEIQYEAESTSHVDVVNYSLAISTSMVSMCSGALLGAILGTVAQNLISERVAFDPSLPVNWPQLLKVIATTVANVILSMMAVIVFSRKKDVQPILSIEDFWGSILIGFLVGYNGHAFFDKLLPSEVKPHFSSP